MTVVCILYCVSGLCETDVSYPLVLSKGKSMRYAVFDAGWVCVFGAEYACLAQIWKLCGKYVVGETLFSGEGVCVVGYGCTLQCGSAYWAATQTLGAELECCGSFLLTAGQPWAW